MMNGIKTHPLLDDSSSWRSIIGYPQLNRNRFVIRRTDKGLPLYQPDGSIGPGRPSLSSSMYTHPQLLVFFWNKYFKIISRLYSSTDYNEGLSHRYFVDHHQISIEWHVDWIGINQSGECNEISIFRIGWWRCTSSLEGSFETLQEVILGTCVDCLETVCSEF